MRWGNRVDRVPETDGVPHSELREIVLELLKAFIRIPASRNQLALPFPDVRYRPDAKRHARRSRRICGAKIPLAPPSVFAVALSDKVQPTRLLHRRIYHLENCYRSRGLPRWGAASLYAISVVSTCFLLRRKFPYPDQKTPRRTCRRRNCHRRQPAPFRSVSPYHRGSGQNNSRKAEFIAAAPRLLFFVIWHFIAEILPLHFVIPKI